MESDPNVATPPAPEPKPRRSKSRRLLKITAWVIGVLVLLVAGLPWLLSLGFVQSRVTSSLTKALGVPVSIGDYSVGWFSGLSVEGVEIDNPSGHPSGEKMLRLKRMTGDISLPSALRQRFDLKGTVEGLDVRVHQRADGTVNLQQIGKGGGDDAGAADGGDRPPSDLLTRLRLDLRLVGARIDIVHETNGVLESLRDINATITKPFGTSDMKLTVDSELHGPESGGEPGKVSLKADIDANMERPVVVDFATQRLDLARYRPLVEGILGPDQLTALAGVLAGTLTARIDINAKNVELGGKLEMQGPQFAGPLLQGMDVRAERWTVEPNLKIAFHDDGSPPDLDTGGLSIDLDFLQLRGVAAATLRDITGDRPAIGADFAVDLAKLAKLGGPMPPELRERTGSVKGRVAFAIDERAFDPAHLAEHFADYVNADAQLAIDSYTIEGNELRNLAGNVTVRDGKLDLDALAELGGGTAKVTAKTDLHDMARLPGEVTLDVQGARMQDAAVGALRYAVPLLAGLQLDRELDFDARLSTTMSFTGPLRKSTGEGVLEWLNLWTGKGDLALTEGSFTPAAELGQLLSLAGESGKLAFDKAESHFTMAKGTVATSLLKLDSEAQKIGLTGNVKLTGEIDYSIDLKPLLAKQKYGAQIIAALGDGAVAKLAGTLNAPKLALPDIGKLAQDALTNAAREAAENALRDNVQKKADDALKKGLDKLFKKK